VARDVASLGTFRRAIELADSAGLANRVAEATVAAFRELGDHLVVSERGQLLSGRGVGHDKLAMEREVIKLALEQAKGGVTKALDSRECHIRHLHTHSARDTKTYSTNGSHHVQPKEQE